MIILQSMDKFDTMAVLSPDDGQVSWFSRVENPLMASRPIRGHIARLQGRTLLLYRRQGVLHFRVDDKDFELTEDTRIRVVSVDENMNCITISHQEDPIFAWTYQRPIIDPPLAMDPTPFVEEEDFDFCLFVHNVAADPLRKSRIYTGESRLGD